MQTIRPALCIVILCIQLFPCRIRNQMEASALTIAPKSYSLVQRWHAYILGHYNRIPSVHQSKSIHSQKLLPFKNSCTFQHNLQGFVRCVHMTTAFHNRQKKLSSHKGTTKKITGHRCIVYSV